MGKQLTVKELIAELKKMPQDLPVSVEGCDCYQDAAGCTVQNFDGDYVLIFNSENKLATPKSKED